MKSTVATATSSITPVSGLFLANGLIMGAWAPHIPLLAQRHGLTESALALVLFAFAGGGIAGMFGVPLLTRRFSARRVATASGVGLSIALLLPLTAGSYPVLAACAAVFGVLNGAMDVAMNADAVAVELQVRRTVMSRFHAWYSVGGFGGALLVGELLARGGSPAFNAVLLSTVALGLLIPALRAPSSESITPPAESKSRAAARGPAALLIPLCVIAFFSLVGEGAMSDWTAKFLHDLDAGPRQMAAGYAAFAVGMAAGRFSGDAWVRRLGPGRLVAGGAALAAAGIAIGLLAGRPGIIIPGLLAAGMGFANIVPIVFRAAGQASHNPAGGLAVVTACGYSGVLLGPVMIGFTAEYVGLGTALWLVVGGMGVVTVAQRFCFSEPTVLDI